MFFSRDIIQLYQSNQNHLLFINLPTKIYFWVTHFGAIIWVLLWWHTLRVRNNTKKSKSHFVMDVIEYQSPIIRVQRRVNFFRIFILITISFLANITISYNTIYGILLIILIQLITTILFGPIVYWDINFIRPIPTGCLLLLYVINDVCLFLDSQNFQFLATQEARMNIMSKVILAIFATVLTFTGIYYAHVNIMKIKEKPQPILLLFLVWGAISCIIVGMWTFNI